MNKFSIIIFICIIGIIGGLVYATQDNSLTKFDTKVPSLPPAADILKLLTPSPQQAQGQGQQQQVQGQQTQQQADQVQPTFGVEEGVKASYSAIIKTSKGNITVTLFGKDSPKTVRNFINKASSDFYKNLLFHRVENWVIQGGDPKGDGTGGGLILTEPNAIPFTAGSLGAARASNPQVSNDSQFFITKSDASWLNGQYTNFGTVTEGMDVVNKIQIGDKILGITVDEGK
jgi:peptidyl-prolyl cis-trans isomerase B (cyclophilin B)